MEKGLEKFGTFEQSSKMSEEYSGVDSFNNIFRIYVLLEMVLELVAMEQYESVFKGDIITAKLILHIIEGVCLSSLNLSCMWF